MFGRMLSLTALALLAFGLLPGCVYFKDRMNDLADIGGVELSAGMQLGASARVTKIAQAGLAFNSGDAASWDNRTLACYEENRWEAGVSILYANQAKRNMHAANEDYDEASFEDNEGTYYDLDRGYDRGFFEVGGRVGLGFVGAGAFVDPYQIADFILGFLFLDISRDDQRNQHREDLSGLLGDRWPPMEDEEAAMDDAHME